VTDEDDLFTPTIGAARRPGAFRRPWRLGSQFWVAFFGGPIAAAVIAYLNAQRLGIADRRRLLMLATGAAGFFVGIGAAVAVTSLEYGGTAARLGNQIAGVLAYVVLYRLQRPADRVYVFYGSSKEDDEAYDSLWGPGLAAVFGLGFPSALLIAGLTD
jgi:hypothetical protein